MFHYIYKVCLLKKCFSISQWKIEVQDSDLTSLSDLPCHFIKCKPLIKIYKLKDTVFSTRHEVHRSSLPFP